MYKGSKYMVRYNKYYVKTIRNFSLHFGIYYVCNSVVRWNFLNMEIRGIVIYHQRAYRPRTNQ
jgi:hypothetical protein